MSRQELHRQLAQLHSELQRVKSPDASEREMLQKLADDIEQVLDQREDQHQQYRRLSERLRKAVAQLEASHPAITMLMGQVIDQLAYMGI